MKIILQTIYIFVWSITIVNSQFTTSSPVSEKCDCVDFQHCHEGLMNYANEFVFDYRITKCGKYETCCYHSVADMDATVKTVEPKDPNEYKLCGIRNTSIPLVSGIDPQPGEFPWMVVVLEAIDSDHKYLSGGSLIHPKVILTTAHKLFDTNLRIFKTNLVVLVGANVLSTDEGIIVDVKNILPHENFSYEASHNNIALLLLKTELILGPTVRTICLPPLNVDFEPKKTCVATGFGKKTLDSTLLTRNLKKINLPLLSNTDCQQKIRTIPRSTPYFRLDNSLLCAGGIKGTDTCEGDGGSPLICSNKYYYQVGIVAYGFGCFQNYPGVYTNVTHFYKWIVDAFVALGLDTKTFTPE